METTHDEPGFFGQVFVLGHLRSLGGDPGTPAKVPLGDAECGLRGPVISAIFPMLFFRREWDGRLYLIYIYIYIFDLRCSQERKAANFLHFGMSQMAQIEALFEWCNFSLGRKDLKQAVVS